MSLLINDASSSSSSYVGGLVGWNEGDSTIENSYAVGKVSSSVAHDKSYSRAEGLVGFNFTDLTIEDSYAMGNVSSSSSHSTRSE